MNVLRSVSVANAHVRIKISPRAAAVVERFEGWLVSFAIPMDGTSSASAIVIQDEEVVSLPGSPLRVCQSQRFR